MPNALVKFKTAGRGHAVDGGDLELQVGQVVVVDTDTGLGIADVVRLLPPGGAGRVGSSPRKVVRLADDSDLQRRRSIEEREREARVFILERIRERGLEMKLVAAEFAFDMTRLDIYFSSEERIDFRNLQKDCTAQFHMRIEFKQIGARDAAKLIGGIGPCGRELCCSTWLPGFASVNVRTVKLQNLSLNPTNIAGVCGKLKCCLNYEADLYTEILRDLPKSGKRVLTELGEGRVTNHNIFRRTVFVRIPEIGEMEFQPDQVVLASVAAADPNALPWLRKPKARDEEPEMEPVSAKVVRPSETGAEESDKEEDELELEKIGAKLSESEAHFGAFMARSGQTPDRDRRRDPRQTDPREKAMEASGVARPQPQSQRPQQGRDGRPQGRDGRPQGGRDGRPQGQQQQAQQQRPPRPPQQARPAQQPPQPRPEGQPGAEGERKEGQSPGGRRRRRRGRGGRGGGGGGSPQGGAA